MKKLSLIFLLLPLLTRAQTPDFRYAVHHAAAAPQSPVGYYKSVTISNSVVSGGSNLTNFPFLISATYSYLATVANSGLVQNANGYDITFSSDSVGLSPLSWDVEQWSPTTGNIQVWVNIPTLSASANTVIYIHYGNAAFTTYQCNRAATWNSSYVFVGHFSETITAAGQIIHDATSNGNNITAQGTSWGSGQQATGAVGPSLKFLFANNNYGQFPNTLTLSGTYSVEGWYNTSTLTGAAIALGSSSAVVGTNWASSDYQVYNGTIATITDGTATVVNTWTHLAWTQNGTAMTMYHNGGSPTNSSNGGSISFNYLSAYETNISPNIAYDELRISNVTRSAGWIATEYSNMHTPTSYYTMGTQFFN